MKIHSTAQRGSALIISLIILLVMTVVGIQGMQSSTLEEKMSGNYRDRARAFEAAEAALVAGENALNLLTARPLATDTGANGVWTFGSVDLSDSGIWASDGLVATTSMQIGSGSDFVGISEAPKYIIEDRGVSAGTGRGSAEKASQNTKSGSSGTTVSYRITARGVGSTPNSVVYLQSNYEIAF